MSFGTKIAELLNSGTTLNSLVNNQIYLHTIDTNKSIGNTFIVYTYNIDNTIDVMGSKDIIKEYKLNITIASGDGDEKIDIIFDELNSLIGDYEDDNIRDIQLNDDVNVYDIETKVHTKNIEYKVYYES